MAGGTVGNIEKLLQGQTISDPSHKAELHRRLFEEAAVLSVEDLEGVIGGVMTDMAKFEAWSEEAVGKE